MIVIQQWVIFNHTLHLVNGNVVGMEQSYRAHAVYLKNNRNHKKGDARLYLFYDKNKNGYVAY